jgi:hypothetical protein
MPTRLRLHPNEEWPSIVDQLLDGERPIDRAKARAVMWFQVMNFITQRIKLPLGPLSDDPDVRSDVAVRVMERVEKDDYRWVRRWRTSQRERKNPKTWWGQVTTIAWWTSIDLARGSLLNVAPRGGKFQWQKVVPMDPLVITGLSGGSILTFVQTCLDEDLRACLLEFRNMYRVNDSSKVQNDEPTPENAPTEPRLRQDTRRRRR